MNELQIPDHMTIDNLDTLKVLTDSMRLQIMRQIGLVNKNGERCTVKRLAELMGMAPSKLYYHIKLLEEHGLLVVGETQVVSGIIEKHYQVAALDISISRKAITTQSGPKDLALEKILDSIGAIVSNSVTNARASLFARFEETMANEGEDGGDGLTGDDEEDEDDIDLHVIQSNFVLAEAEADEFTEKLIALIREYSNVSDVNMTAAKAEDGPKIGEDLLHFELTQMLVPMYHRRS